MNLISLKERIAIGEPLAPDERNFVLDAINAYIPPVEIPKHDPGNYLGRIEQIWAFLSVDDGGEGVCAAPMMRIGAMPLIAADKRRLEQLKPFARMVASTFRKPVRLAKFTAREDVEIYQP